jgi:hypothetical protein
MKMRVAWWLLCVPFFIEGEGRASLFRSRVYNSYTSDSLRTLLSKIVRVREFKFWISVDKVLRLDRPLAKYDRTKSVLRGITSLVASNFRWRWILEVFDVYGH